MVKLIKLACYTIAFGTMFLSCESQATEGQKEAQEEAKQTVEAKPTATQTVAKDGLQVGEQAQDFELKNIDGQSYRLADVKLSNGEDPKGYILTFTCNTCPYAKANEDRIIALHNEMEPLGYPVIAINPNDPGRSPGDSFEKMKERAAEKSFPFLYLFDEEQTVYPFFGATKTPEIYLLDETLTLRYTGAIDNNPMDAEAATVNYVKNAIDAINEGQSPDPVSTKAIGCGIKKKST